jgi:pseudouridine synthase
MNAQRYLVAAGFGSRRACDKLITDKRVVVNGKTLEHGLQIFETDEVFVDGIRISAQTTNIYIALNKPEGFISDHGDTNSPSALDIAGIPKGLHAIGRLDKDATGLLLLTNDGILSHRLTHPSFEHEKEYWVCVEGVPNQTTLNQWRAGVLIEGEVTPTAPCYVEIIPPPINLNTKAHTSWLRIILHEGRKRQIKRVGRALRHPIIRLIRVRIGTVKLGNLPIGAWRYLSANEQKALLATAHNNKQLS